MTCPQRRHDTVCRCLPVPEHRNAKRGGHAAVARDGRMTRKYVIPCTGSQVQWHTCRAVPVLLGCVGIRVTLPFVAE